MGYLTDDVSFCVLKSFGEQLIQFSRYPNVLLMRFCSIIEIGPKPQPQPQVMCIMTPDKDCEEGKWARQYTEVLQGKGN